MPRRLKLPLRSKRWTTTRAPLPPRPRRARAVAGIVVVIVGLAVAAAALLRRDATLHVTEQRLVSSGGMAHRTPSYSPDGSMLAYAAPDAMGVQQIWVQTLAQGSTLQVTSGKNDASRPRWLSGTNQILFAVAGQGLWTVAPMGGTPTRLIERGSNPNVARDGSRLVFEGQSTVWTAAPDGSDIQRVKGVITPPFNLPMSPALSPDGRTIAYFSAQFGPNGDFWTIPAAGGTPTRLTNDLREGGWPVWTSDGRAIIVSSARAGSRTLWQIPVDGGPPSALTTGAGEDDQPDLSSDGRQLAYTNARNTWELARERSREW